MNGSRGAKEQMKKETLKSAEQQTENFEKALGELTNQMFKLGMTPKEAMNMNPNTLESMYAQAYRLYNSGKYVEAIHLFRLLILLNTMESKYILGLAACFHMLKEYQNAIEAYTMCGVIDPQSPLPSYHSSDCFMQMKDYVSAMICLEMAVKRAGNKPEYNKIKERAHLSLERLKQQLASHPMQEDEASST